MEMLFTIPCSWLPDAGILGVIDACVPHLVLFCAVSYMLWRESRQSAPHAEEHFLRRISYIPGYVRPTTANGIYAHAEGYGIAVKRTRRMHVPFTALAAPHGCYAWRTILTIHCWEIIDPLLYSVVAVSLSDYIVGDEAVTLLMEVMSLLYSVHYSDTFTICGIRVLYLYLYSLLLLFNPCYCSVIVLFCYCMVEAENIPAVTMLLFDSCCIYLLYVVMLPFSQATCLLCSCRSAFSAVYCYLLMEVLLFSLVIASTSCIHLLRVLRLMPLFTSRWWCHHLEQITSYSFILLLWFTLPLYVFIALHSPIRRTSCRLLLVILSEILTQSVLLRYHLCLYILIRCLVVVR